MGHFRNMILRVLILIHYAKAAFGRLNNWIMIYFASFFLGFKPILTMVNMVKKGWPSTVEKTISLKIQVILKYSFDVLIAKAVGDLSEQ